jgi:ribosome-associated translation inhibitor RaiA
VPDGIIQWFDADAGEGRVLHRRRRYAVLAGDIEKDARTPGARVHFDIDHATDGMRAKSVTLRRGIRSAKAQRRFGDTTGAPTDSAKKPMTTSHESFDFDPEMYRSPIRAAEYFAQQLSIGDLDEVMVLYSPTASLHLGDETLTGLDEIRQHWQRSAQLSGPAPSAVRGGEDGSVVIRWPVRDAQGSQSRMSISNGEITEQWLGAFSDSQPDQDDDGLPVEISVDGRVGQRHRDKAVERIGKVLSKADEPLLHARIRLVNLPDSGRDRPVTASIMLDINGEPIRATVTHTDLDAAIDELESRLAQQLERVASHRETMRKRGPSSPSGEWRHGDLPTDRPGYHPRPPEERQVVRHKTFTTIEATIDEAIFDMEAMDYSFFLFTDLATGQEAVVTRGEGGVYTVQLQDGLDEETFVREVAAAIEPLPDPARRLSMSEARELLDMGADPWVFFVDEQDGRGRVLYRRYDGHYGLITPRTTDPEGGLADA